MIELKTYKMVDEKYCTDCVCVIPSEVYLKKDADEAIAELKQKLEDARMRERKLKRALWLARAQRANEHYHRYHGKFLCPLEDIPEYVKWKQVESKCLKKAEEYK